MVQQMIEGCFDPSRWQVPLHGGATWEQVWRRSGGGGGAGARHLRCFRLDRAACQRDWIALAGPIKLQQPTTPPALPQHHRSPRTASRCTPSPAACARAASPTARCGWITRGCTSRWTRGGSPWQRRLTSSRHVYWGEGGDWGLRGVGWVGVRCDWPSDCGPGPHPEPSGLPPRPLRPPPQEANQLVEEFMLLANMRVAKLISDEFSSHAVLRCVLFFNHPFWGARCAGVAGAGEARARRADLLPVCAESPSNHSARSPPPSPLPQLPPAAQRAEDEGAGAGGQGAGRRPGHLHRGCGRSVGAQRLLSSAPSFCRPHAPPRTASQPSSRPAPPGPALPSPAGALQRCLASLRAATDDPGTAEVVTLLATKPMQLAQYFCTADRDRKAWAHYALAVDLYTHFTSPIR
jgi:hypothetical protein